MEFKANPLGDVRAEADSQMLDTAFFKSADYQTLLETTDRSVVVGRRGTGKSAIVYMLSRSLSQAPNVTVVKLAATEDQIIGLRPLVNLFGEKFSLVRAGARVAWRYAILLEIADKLSPRFKSKSTKNTEYLNRLLGDWRSGDHGFCGRLKQKLRGACGSSDTAEERVSDLAQKLQIKEVEIALRAVLEDFEEEVVVCLDRLDEGYEPDQPGIALVDGLVHAVIDTNTKFARIRSLIFLRDNIFRAVAKNDPDYSRSIEGQVLRLHWDEYSLLELVTNRIRAAFGVDQENTLRVWNKYASRGLKGKVGFRKCLRLTLYRPRDILILLNEAFLHAAQEKRESIIDADVESTAKSISTSRLDDLEKEYEAVYPGLKIFHVAFANSAPEMKFKEAVATVEKVVSSDSHSPEVQQQIAIAQSTTEIVRDLYRVGFLGVRDEASRNFVFSHDGREPNREFDDEKTVLIHPCYWMALNLTRSTLDQDEAEEIYDEYDIDVASENPEERRARLETIMAELASIPEGRDGAGKFEDWCLKAVRILYAGALRNAELHPNKNATQRRDVVATNLGLTPIWKRVYDDYKSRQVIFEVKNFKQLEGDHYRQMLSYLSGEYGRLGFIITRDEDENLRKGKELEWMREMYSSHGVLIVKLSGKYFVQMLSKIRSQQKHNAPDKSLNGLLDRYARMYIAGVTKGR